MTFQSTVPCEQATPKLRRSYSDGAIFDFFRHYSTECGEECDFQVVEKNTFYELAEFHEEEEQQQCLWDFPKKSCKGDHTPCSATTLSTNGDDEDSSDNESWSASASPQSTFEFPSSFMDVSPTSQSSPMHPPGVFPPGVFATPISFCMPENRSSWADSVPHDDIVEIHATAGRSSRRRHRRRTCKLSAAEEQRGLCVMNGWPTQEPNQQENSPDERTTLLLKNIPPSCTTAMLVDMLNSQGFDGCYNFVYAPTDFRSLTSFGYGFVNLVSFNEAVRMMECLDGYDGWASTGINSMEVCWSMPHQGLDLQIRRFQNSPVMHPSVPDEIKPMIFTDGVRSPFPEPTKQLREPRARRPASETI